MQRAIQRSNGKLSLAGAVAAAALLSLALALLNTGKASDRKVAVASTHVLIDSAPVSAVHRINDQTTSLTKRAELLGRVLVSPPVVDLIVRRAHVPPDQIAAAARYTADLPQALTEPASEQRASEIRGSGLRYRIEVQARQNTPVLDIYTQAPTTAAAERLANAAIAGLRDYLGDLSQREGLGGHDMVRLRQLGSARGGVVNGGAHLAIALLTFLVAFPLLCAAFLYVVGRRVPGTALATSRPTRELGGDWPGTTRLLPWMLAAFIAILWLAPFNDIELNANFPIDMKLDRLFLPFVALSWALALAVAGRLAPRSRLTVIHVAVGAFLLCAFVSVALDARYLNQTLELDRSLKGLPLLVSYVSLFVIAATAVRRTEVHAFMKYTLMLAVICAVGMLWEYRFGQNLFYDWADKLLPGNFSVKQLAAGAIDSDGRRMVRGPAELSLEAVAMLSMALPIALVGFMHAQRQRERVLNGLAACLLLAATFATFRKSALLVPASVILTVACFRRRELLKLAPLGVLVLVLVHVLAPGALGSTTKQFGFERLGATTVSARTADYDAIRPDLWSHLLFGRGWGAYDHLSYRILDSEILHRTMEMGVLGLLAFLFMGVAVVVGARATIAQRDPVWAPLALMGAAAAVAFLAVSVLFDVMSFPHGAYIFLYMAGLVAVVIGHRADGDEPSYPPAHVRSHTTRRPLEALPSLGGASARRRGSGRELRPAETPSRAQKT
jgi:hypothetical protein